MGILAFYGTTILEISRATVAEPDIFSKCFRSEPQKGAAAIKFKRVKMQLQ